MDAMATLRQAARELTAAEARRDKAREARDSLIVQTALETEMTYEDIGAATGLTLSAVWKITNRAGITRSRVQRPRAAASG